MSAPLNDRPRPLAEAARLWGRIMAAVGGVVSGLSTAGILTLGQADTVSATFTALDGLITAGVVVVTAGTALLAAFGIVRKAEPLVTPNSDPVGPAYPGGPLVSLVPVED